ncbi:MAG: esterase family protein [Candidatus Xenobia bacterium]
MQGHTHHWYSPALGQDMYLKTFGDRGQPVIVFPAQEGRFYEFEDFAMVEAVRPFIEEGRVQLICVDGVDSQAWCNQGIPPHERVHRANAYDRYLLDEVIPFTRARGNGLTVTGCSMGGYHSANFFFRHPDVADSVIALSGVYDLTLFIGDAMNPDIYYHVPLAYLPGMQDPWFLDRYRQGHIVLCVGQGDWEDPMLPQTRRMADILRDKSVPAWVDIWGPEVSHDWTWWRQQLPYFLQHVLNSLDVPPGDGTLDRVVP